MQIEKNAASTLNPTDMAAIIRQAHYERSLVFSALVSKVGKAIGKFLLGANHSLIEMPDAEWQGEVPFHSRQALGVNDAIASKADHDAFIDQAAPVLPFATVPASLDAAEEVDSKIAA